MELLTHPPPTLTSGTRALWIVLAKRRENAVQNVELLDERDICPRLTLPKLPGILTQRVRGAAKAQGRVFLCVYLRSKYITARHVSVLM